MATPLQTRAIDPFAEYNSNVHNMLTRILSQGTNCLLSRNAINVIRHPTSPQTRVTVKAGIAIKDDVMIQVLEDTDLDFDTNSNFLNPEGGFNETGWHYVCMSYTYQKSRPAPEARLVILRPSERGTYSPTGSLLFLKAIYAINNGTRNIIDPNTEFSSYDPQNPSNKRQYVYRYVSTEPALPSHNPNRDPSRFVYDESKDSFFLGYANRWEQLSNNTMGCNTSGVASGLLAFYNSSGVAQAAISTNAETRAEMVVVNSAAEGQAKIIGFVEDVPVETGITMFVGDVVYLSATQAGRVTNIRPASYQCVGRCIAVGTGVIDLLFIPGPFVASSVVPTVKYTFVISVADWQTNIENTTVHYDAAIPNIGSNAWVASLKDSSGYQVDPYWFRYKYTGGQHYVEVRMAARPSDTMYLTVIG